MIMDFDMDELKQNRNLLTGVCSGVYLLFNNDELVYVGESWNCFLGVAENKTKKNNKEFTSWTFIPIDDETKRRDLKKQLIQEYTPTYNIR